MALSRMVEVPATTPQRSSLPAASARRLLRAAGETDLSGFERELDRARLIAAQTPGRGAEAAERLELLQAITGDLNAQLELARQGQSPSLANLETNLFLLRHLTGAPARSHTPRMSYP